MRQFSSCWTSSIDFYGVFLYQNPREASSRSRILLISLVYVCIYLCICVTSLGQTKNDTDLKFGTHTPIDFCFFDQITVTAASLEKLPCHVDFGFSAYLLDCLVSVLICNWLQTSRKFLINETLVWIWAHYVTSDFNYRIKKMPTTLNSTQ